MKLLMLSTDEKIFEENSAVRQRMIDYGKNLEELHIIVYTRRIPGIIKSELASNVFAYPTNTIFKPLYFWDAYRLGKIIPGISEITSQDPFETGLAGYFLKNKLQIPLEFQAHTDFLSPYFKRESLKNRLRVILAKWLIRKADHIRVVSDRIKKSLLALYPIPHTLNTISVRPIVVDVEKIKNAPIKTNLRKKYPAYSYIILMVSRFTKEKNLLLAIDAMANVIKDFPKALLLIVGEGSEKKNVEYRILNLGLKDNVKMEPWTDDLASYYKTADLYLLTSNYEGYGRTAVEAQAAGMPVLMTDVGVAIGEVIPVGDLLALVEKLKSFLKRKIQ